MGNLLFLSFLRSRESLSMLVISAFVFAFLFFSSVVSAQTTCDLCGKCGTEQPADYDRCVQCVYDGTVTNTPREGYSWTVIGCIETSPAGFTQKALQFITTVAGGIIFIVMLFGSFLVLTSAGDPEQLTRGRGMLKSGVIALILILFSVFILQYVGVNILRIPGWE